jgi:acyl-CoA thioester hydrolase
LTFWNGIWYYDAMVSKCSLQVRTYECDSYGHVNNANYLNYLEYARYELLKDIGFNYEKAVGSGYGIFISRIEINYKRPALTDDCLTITTWPLKKGAVSGTLAQEIRRGDDLVADAKVTWAFVEASAGMPVRIPQELDVPGLRP